MRQSSRGLEPRPTPIAMDPLEPWIDASAVRRLAENLLSEPRGVSVEASPDAGFGQEFVGFAVDRPKAVEPAFTAPPTPPTTAVAAAPAPQVREREAIPQPVAAPAPVAAPVSEAPPRVFTPVQEVAPPPVPQLVPAPQPSAVPAAEAAAAPAPSPVPAPVRVPATETAPAPVPASAPQQERRGPLLERLVRFRELLMRHTGAQGVFILDREGKPVMDDPAFGKLHFLARSLAQAYRPVAGQAGNVHVKIGSNAVLEVVPVETPFGWLVLGAVVPGPLTAAAVAEIAAALRLAATPREAGS